MFEIVFSDTFTEIAVILMLSSALGAIGLKLKQPLVVTFIAVGILVGPSALGWVSQNDQVDLLAKLGIALLLFLVGLKLDLYIIKTMGKVALAAGLGQVIFTSVFGYFIALALGLSSIAALYVAVALTFSSTIIIVKLLSDKQELDDLHGQIAIGFLIVQDIVVVLVMIALTAMGNADADESLFLQAIQILGYGATFMLSIFLISRFVLTPLMSQLVDSSELMVLFSIAWAVILAAVGVHLGFSKEVGAFLAGVAVASTPYREVVASRLVTLRDFLLLFFFIDLGVGLDLSVLGEQLAAAMVFSIIVLIGNPLIVVLILSWLGYTARTGFMAGLAVAQISEFSLILAALGLSQGHIDQEIVGLITLVGLITISMSTYMILYSEPLFERLEPYILKLPLRKTSYREETPEHEQAYDAIVFGWSRLSSKVIKTLSKQGKKVLVVDKDEDKLCSVSSSLCEVRSGDMDDINFLETLPFSQTKSVISATRCLSDELSMLSLLKDHSYQGRTMVLAENDKDAAMLEKYEVDHIVMVDQSVAEVMVNTLA